MSEDPVQNQTSQPLGPAVVHVARPLEPEAVEASLALREKHRRSVAQFSQLDLSEFEYVVLNVRRHLIGLIGPSILVGIVICFLVAGLILLPDLIAQYGWEIGDVSLINLIGWISVLLLGLGVYVYYWVYTNNILFLTNESIIERTQVSLFMNSVKSVGLGDVVDISFSKTGVVQHLFDYGTLRIGTKYDKAPYIFRYVSSPRVQTAIMTEAVECFKNGRPVGESELLKKYAAR